MTEPSATSDGGVSLGGDGGAPQTALWGFWATAAWALVVVAIYVAAMLGTTLAVEWFRIGPAYLGVAQPMISGAAKSFSFSLSGLVATFVCCGTIVAIIRLKKHASVREYLCLKPVAFMNLLKWIGLLVVMQIVVALILAWLDLSIDDDLMADIYKNANPAWVLWLALVVAIPLFEEIFVRGFLLAGLAASFLRPIGAVLVTTGLWTALHIQYNAVGLAVVFCLGLLFGAARLRTGSIIVPLALHMMENVLAVAATATAS